MNNAVRAAIQRHVEAPRLLRMGGALGGGRALEIGCGRVGTELIFEVFGAQSVDAFDLDSRMIVRARRQLARFGSRVRLWVGDASAISATGVIRRAKESGGIVMVLRIWHGWTSPAHADQYEALLREVIFGDIAGRRIAGYHGIKLLRRDAAGEVEFVTIMSFDSVDAVRQFAGADYEAAVVPPKAQALLSRFDERSQHYELRVDRRS